MAIGRIILHESYLDSPDLLKCSEAAQDQFPKLLLATADAHGCFKVNIPQIRAKTFPHRPKVTNDKIQKWLDEYESVGMLQIWMVEGRLYGFWTAWNKYNRPDTRYSWKTPKPPDTNDHKRSHEIPEDPMRSPLPDPDPVPVPDPDPDPKDFVKFWDISKEIYKSLSYPIGNRQEALTGWNKQNGVMPDVDALVESLRFQALAKKSLIESGKSPAKLKHLCRWIKFQCWDDDPDPVDKPGQSTQLLQGRSQCKCEHPWSFHKKGPCMLPVCGCEKYEEELEESTEGSQV